MPAIPDEVRDLTLPKIGAFTVGTAAAIYIAVYAVRSDNELLPLLALASAIVGWTVGVLATPFSKGEGKHFGDLAKVISGFFTGYLLSKIDPLVDRLFAAQPGGRGAMMDPQSAEQLLVALASFGIALLFVFNARLYWSPKKRRAQPN